MSETNKIEEFRFVACNDSLTNEQIRTYLQWAKGKVDVALNYYFNKIEKNKPMAPPPPPPENNAYKKLKEGAQKEKRTADYIDSLKKEYKLPIKGKPCPDVISINDSSEFGEIDYIPDVLNNRAHRAEEVVSNGKSSKIGSSTQVPTKRYSTVVLASQTQPQPQRQIMHPKPASPTKHPKPKPPANSQIQQQQSQSQTSPSRQLRDLPLNTDIRLGTFLVNCFAVTNLYLPGCNQGTPVQIRIQKSMKQDVKPKKTFKRATQRIMMRIAWNDREIGRIEDEDAQFICRLIDGGFVRMYAKMKESLTTVSHFTPFKVQAEVFLKKNSITVPIVETYENKADQNDILKKFGEVRENFITLFRRLELNVSKYPLIKLKSKYDQLAIPTNKTKSSSCINPEALIQCRVKSQKQDYEKAHNPFYKEVQPKLNEMFGVRSSNHTQNHQKKQIQKKEYEGAVTRNVQLKPSNFEQLVDLHEQNLEETQPNPLFTSKLHQYQSLALSWMLRRQGKSSVVEEDSLHPMWMEYELPTKGHLYFNEFNGQISIQPPYFKSRCKGGILADEMGLGKTVMLIALMCTNQPENRKIAKNLIVLPLTLLQQWESEIILHTKKHSLRILKYYEQKDRKVNLLDYDIVLTTYGVVSQQFAEGNHVSCTGLFKQEWFRIILDQAHYIKGRVIQTARAVFSLRSQINWCLTGTPIQNKLQDLYSLIHFIRYTPWSDYSWWNCYINKPHQENDPVVFEVLRSILKKVLLRRTKQSKKADGQPIINLPPKHSKIQYLRLSSKEQKFYNAVFQASKKQFDELQQQGIIEAKYMKIFEILMRLRQICCHPILFKSITKFSSVQDFPAELKKWLKKRIEERNDVDNHARFELVMEGEQQVRVEVGKLKYNEKRLIEILESIDRDTLQLCSICMDPLQNPVITVCLHTYCKSCIVQAMQTVGFCPQCRTIINKDDFLPLPRQNRLGVSFQSQFTPSTKMQALMAHLQTMQKDSKAVVFSQFLGMIDLVEQHMKRQRINYVRMDGSLSQKQRSVVIDRFKTDPKCQVFIISLKSGGVGLNLVAANKVFMVDPWWNPAVQEQAIERVHRIGQKREVEVYRFIVENSIESRMMELHQSKRNISAMAMSEKESKENNLEKFKYLMMKY